MKLHANARTCPNSRKLLVGQIEEEDCSLMVAEAASIKRAIGRKWLGGAGAQKRTLACSIAPPSPSPLAAECPRSRPSHWSKRSPPCAGCG
jgi:hypothetical protein